MIARPAIYSPQAKHGFQAESTLDATIQSNRASSGPAGATRLPFL